MIVFDQFETEPISTYSGSYTDDVVYGTMFGSQAEYELGYSIPGTGKFTARRVIASKASRPTVDFTSGTWMPLYLASGLVSGNLLGRPRNFVKHSTDKEFFFDSFVPNPVDIHITNGGTVYLLNQASWGSGPSNEVSGSEWGIKPYQSGSGLAIIFDRYPKPGAGTFLGGQSDNKWTFQFPFESKFKSINRLLSFSTELPKEYTVSADTNNNTFTPASSSNFLTSIITNGTNESLVSAGVVKAPNDTFLNIQLNSHNFGTGATIDLMNLYFGTGDGKVNSDGSGGGSGQQLKGANITIQDKTFLNPDSPATTQVLFLTRVMIKGYKYGIKSTVPEQTSVVFRRGKYGQFRDLLEQRPLGKFLDRTKGNSKTTSPVNITFISGTLAAARAIDYITASNPTYNPTDSGIYDYEYKSGQPFFDG